MLAAAAAAAAGAAAAAPLAQRHRDQGSTRHTVEVVKQSAKGERSFHGESD